MTGTWEAVSQLNRHMEPIPHPLLSPWIGLILLSGGVVNSPSGPSYRVVSASCLVNARARAVGSARVPRLLEPRSCRGRRALHHPGGQTLNLDTGS